MSITDEPHVRDPAGKKGQRTLERLCTTHTRSLILVLIPCFYMFVCKPIIIPTRKEEKIKGNKKQIGRSRFYTVDSYDDVTVI